MNREQYEFWCDMGKTVPMLADWVEDMFAMNLSVDEVRRLIRDASKLEHARRENNAL